MLASRPVKLSAQVGSEEREIEIEPVEGVEGRWRVVIGGQERIVDARRFAPGSYALTSGDEVTVVDVDPGKDGDLLVEVRGVTIPVTLVDPRRKLLDRLQGQVRRPHGTGKVVLASPMPGKVVKVLCSAGDEVAAGAGLVVVEAMKMENELRAPRAGKVEKVHVKEGQPVEGQETLVTLE
jgi:biotin carboxyl carrier protein